MNEYYFDKFIEEPNEWKETDFQEILETFKELEIKPSLLKKAIKIAQKSKLTETNADHETVQDILETVGRTV